MQSICKNRNVQAKQTLVRGTSLDTLVSRIRLILTEARTEVVRTVNSQMVRAYWLIGREIVEDEQQGKHRAGYGESLVENLSVRLIEDYGKGFTPTNLRYMRLFYLTYPDLLTKETRHAVRDQFVVPSSFNENLSWTHYRLLTKVESIEARSFYEIETVKNRWSSRELERRINSLLFERLAKSRDKKGVLALATRGHEIQKPEDTIKDPVVLEFLGLPESEKLVESELEQALLDNLKKFLLELGRGFAFVDRQQRLTLDGDHFYVDLVFYHTILIGFRVEERRVAYRVRRRRSPQASVFVCSKGARF
jgi:predicted nuclease of restriction endonuclease-like (RecB) superfamily